MSKPKVYIDGKEGTTGLQIYERLGGREDIELLLIDEDKRKNAEERKKFLNAADLVFLCLPDAAAVEAVSLIENPKTRIIDASTAHRTAEGWVYGFAELLPGQRQRIKFSSRVANPGCHATGFLSTEMCIRDSSRSDRIRARSFLSGLLLALTPQWTPAAWKPRAAHTPPEISFNMRDTLLLFHRGAQCAPHRRTRYYRLSPAVSSNPIIMFIFWTAAPDAPFPRLSNWAVSSVCSCVPETVISRLSFPASWLVYSRGPAPPKGVTWTSFWSW